MNLSQGTAMFLPAWNEADNLPTVVEEAVTYLRSRGEPFVVIIIDDGSIDHTPQVAAQLQQTYPGDIQFIQHDTNRAVPFQRDASHERAALEAYPACDRRDV